MKQETPPIFFPNLDALRFFCFLSVFFFHSFATNYDSVSTSQTYTFVKRSFFGNGSLGVNFFFVLSGFLITYLLLAEKKKHRKINIGKFYMRRVLRIWPLFYFCVFFGFVIFPLLKTAFGEVANENANPIYYVLFINNFDFVAKGLPDSSVLGILWSVAIEEQFYLFWPLIVGLISTRYLPYAFGGILVVSFLFRYVNAHSYIVLEHHTFSCISDLTIGGLGAYFSFFSKQFLSFLKRMPVLLTALIYLGTVALFFFRKEIFHHNSLLLSLDRLVISIFFLSVILEQNFSERSFFKFQSLKRTSKLGKYTYGLYCLHMIGILIASTVLSKINFNTQVWQVLVVEGLLSLFITILLAYISFHYFEKKFLLLKNKFAILPTSGDSLKPVSGWGTKIEFNRFRRKRSKH